VDRAAAPRRSGRRYGGAVGGRRERRPAILHGHQLLDALRVLPEGLRGGILQGLGTVSSTELVGSRCVPAPAPIEFRERGLADPRMDRAQRAIEGDCGFQADGEGAGAGQSKQDWRARSRRGSAAAEARAVAESGRDVGVDTVQPIQIDRYQRHCLVEPFASIPRNSRSTDSRPEPTRSTRSPQGFGSSPT